jgi:hypothetical protein
MRAILLAAITVLAFTAGPASAQTREREPSLSDDERKPQQNSADEAGVKARLEDGIKPGDAKEQSRVSKKLEDATVEAKRKSDAKK